MFIFVLQSIENGRTIAFDFRLNLLILQFLLAKRKTKNHKKPNKMNKNFNYNRIFSVFVVIVLIIENVLSAVTLDTNQLKLEFHFSISHFFR